MAVACRIWNGGAEIVRPDIARLVGVRVDAHYEVMFAAGSII